MIGRDTRLSLGDLPNEIVYLVLDYLHTPTILALLRLCRGMQTRLTFWPGWSHIQLAKSSAKDSRTLVCQMFALLPRLNVPVLSFVLNHFDDFGDRHLRQLQPFASSLQLLDLRGASRLSERALCEFFSTACANCPLCQTEPGPAARPDSAKATTLLDTPDGSRVHTKPLKALTLSNLPALTDAVLGLIGSRCSKLEKLDIGQLRDYRFTDDGLRSFCKVRRHQSSPLGKPGRLQPEGN
ncbi:hypothetical protein HDU91_007284 [Kappamyces sp. JEL0680]|nr:hypothetical protein HDU91_007284 [Kappamyces sp. JEL0680]